MKLHALTFSNLKNPDAASYANMQLLTEAARVRGHELVAIKANQCQLKFGKTMGALIDHKSPKNIKILIVLASFLGDVDVHGTLIRQFELMGIPVINRHSAIVKAKNKILMLQTLHKNNIPMPKTYIVRSAEYFEEMVQDIGSYPVILKTINGSNGVGVSIVESQRGLRSILDLLTEHPDSLPITIQEYVRESKGKDVRVFVVGTKIVGAMERIANKRGEFRSNFSLGGRVRITELSKKEQELAIKATEVFGLDFAGVDILRTRSGPKIIEINSNPGLSGITQATGRDIAGEIIEYAIRKVRKKNSTKQIRIR